MSTRTPLQLSSVKCLRLCSAALWRFFFGPRPEGVLHLAEGIRPFGRYRIKFPARLFPVRASKNGAHARVHPPECASSWHLLCRRMLHRVRPNLSPRASHRSGLDTLASSGSCHRAKAVRLPLNEGLLPANQLAQISRSSLITGPSSLPRDNPPLSCASVLSASRLEPLAPFPLASPATSSRSVPKSSRGSCRLHAGCRSAGIRASPELIPKVVPTPGFDIA